MCVVAGRLGRLFVGFPVCWTCWERWLKKCVALPRASGSGVTVHMGDGGVGRILLQATPSGGVFVIEGTFHMGANGVSSSIEMSAIAEAAENSFVGEAVAVKVPLCAW